MKYIIAAASLLSLAACASKPSRLIESEWASMTRTSVPHLKDVTETGSVEGRYCHSVFGSGHVGLMDEAILQAQKKYSVDYIRNATFLYNKNEACVSVEGTGYRSSKL